jgi:hypothetical protein
LAETSLNTAADAFALDLRACLDAHDPAAALIAFIPELKRTAGLPRVAVRLSEHGVPHPLTGVGLMLVSGALVQAGRGLDIIPFLKDISDLFAPPHRYYAPGSNLSDILYRFSFLNVPLIKGALADKEQLDAVSLCLRLAKHGDDAQEWIFADPSVATVVAHPATVAFGPWRFDRAWLLENQEMIRAIGPLDGRLERVVEFDQLQLENALLLKQPERGLPVLGADGGSDASFLAAMIANGWLPDGVSTGSYDSYGNTAHYYYRAASMHIALNTPERFTAWIEHPWIKTQLTMAVDRETFRLLDKL